jgi:DNA-binding CsgD family transcriptional regulator
VISEKIVSSHVSNLLRKTHTSSRVELAQLAHRVAQNISSPSAREV